MRDITSANKENAGAAAAVLENLNTHTSNDNIHVTAEEKVKWNNPGAVLYTPQNLTGEQKVQALQNISAAPGWHGLGAGARMLSAADDLNNVWENGWTAWNESIPQNAPFPYCACLTSNMGSSLVIHQTMYTSDGYTLQRFYNGGTGGWKPFEWVNPPLYQDGEYRTTERFLGKPVYAYIKKIGACASGASVYEAIGNVNPQHIISAYGSVDGDMNLPHIYGVPGSADERDYSIHLAVVPSLTTNIAITIFCGAKRSFSSAYVCVKYTKTTD